jgi:CBS domain-containing protein
LAVLDEKNKYIGVISRRQILRSRVDPKGTKVKNLVQNAPKLSLNDSISKMAKLMIESNLRQLPVFEKNKLLGFVSDEALIHAAARQDWGSIQASTIMTKAPHSIDSSRTVGAVLSMFRDYGISHMPVMDKVKLVGIISIQDVINNILQPQRRQTFGDIVGEKYETLTITAKGIMSNPVITIEPQTSIKEAEQKMHDYKIACLPVMLNEKLVGILTKLDFLELITRIEEPQKKITIQLGTKDIEITPDQQAFMLEEFDSFSRKYQEAFQQGTVFVYMKSHGTTSMRGTPLVHCRLQF